MPNRSAVIVFYTVTCRTAGNMNNFISENAQQTKQLQLQKHKAECV